MPTPIKQLLSRTLYATDGVTTIWGFSFGGGYLDKAHIKAYTETPEGNKTNIVVTGGMVVGPFQLSITPALAAGNTLTIYRDTPKDLPIVDFTDESGFSEIALDTNAKQAIFVAAETQDTLVLTVVDSRQVGIEADNAIAAASAAAASASVAVTARDTAILAASAASSSETGVAASAAAALASQTTASANAAAALASQNAATSSQVTASNAAVSATASASSASASAISAAAKEASVNSQAAAILAAQAQQAALLSLGVGSSYVDSNGHLIMSYAAPVTAISIDANGHLQLTY